MESVRWEIDFTYLQGGNTYIPNPGLQQKQCQETQNNACLEHS